MSNLFAKSLAKRSMLWVGVLLLALVVAACGGGSPGGPGPIVPGDPGDGDGGVPPGNGQSGQCPEGVDCVIIRTLADLKAINDLTWSGLDPDLRIPREMTRYYILANDIDASETRNWQNDDGSVGFVPIGKYTDSAGYISIMSFAGYFDGNGKTIKNLHIDRSEADEFINEGTGLFARIDYGGTVADLTLERVNIKGKDGVGGVAGTVDDGTVRNVHVIGSVEGYGGALGGGVGGLVGSNAGKVEDSTFFGDVKAEAYGGGLVGINEADDTTGTIENSSAEATVKGATAGGLVGANHGGTISSSNSRAKVQSDALQGNVGGLVGFNTGTITHSESTTSGDDWIQGMYHVGGLVGGNQGIIEHSGSDANVKSEREPHSGMPGGVGGLAGYNGGGAPTYGGIKNSHSSGQVNAASGHVGGLVGRNNGSGEIESSFSISSVSGREDTGGLVGYNQGFITASFSANELVRGEDNVGGLVGHNSIFSGEDGVIANSYSWSTVKGGSTAGGLVGYLFGGTVKSSYSIGPVDEGDKNGGLIADFSAPANVSVENSYWDVTSSGQPTSEAGGEGKTTEQMQQQATYVGWKTDVWEFPQGDYPDLRDNPRPAELGL